MRNTIARFVGIALLCGMGVGCGGSADDKVATAFLKENPTVTVTAIRSGEGDRSTVYKHIRYRTTGSMTECEVVWAYQQAGHEWKIFHKGEPALAGTVGEDRIRKPCA